jgi:hypothetical protein
MNSKLRSYFSISAAIYQLVACLIPLLYMTLKNDVASYYFAPYFGQIIISSTFIFLLLRGYKWAYILFFAVQAIHLGSLFLQTGFKMYGYNMLLVALSGFGLYARIAKEKEILEVKSQIGNN